MNVHSMLRTLSEIPTMNFKALTLCAILAFAGAAEAQYLRTVPLVRDGLTNRVVGTADHYAETDLTGDGVADLLTCAARSALVLSKQGSSYASAWRSPSVGCQALTLGDRDGDGSTEVMVGVDRTLYVFDPSTYGPAVATMVIPNSIALTGTVQSMAFGNVDGDGAAELVLLYANRTLVYNAQTLALEWEFASGGTEVRIGNVDDDAAPEIVVNGSNGVVLNATTQTIEWTRAGGFGSVMRLGNVDGDSELEIVFALSDVLTKLNGDDRTSSTFEIDGPPESIRVANNLIYVGETGLAAVSCYSAAGARLWSVPMGAPGVADIGAGDVDGDGVVEITFTAGEDNFDADRLKIVADGVVEADLREMNGSYGVEIADLDLDGEPELIVSIFGHLFPAGSGFVEILDAKTRALKASLTLPANTFVWDVRVGQLDADPAREILVQGNTSTTTSGLWVFDAATLALQWSSTTPAGTSSYAMRTLDVANVDADAVDEIVVAHGKVIKVFNGASDTVQWTSPAFASDIFMAATGDIDLDGSADVIASDINALQMFTPVTGATRALPMPAQGSIHGLAATSGFYAVRWTNSVHLYKSDFALVSTRTFAVTPFDWLRTPMLFAALGGTRHLFLAGSHQVAVGRLDTAAPQTLTFAAPNMDMQDLSVNGTMLAIGAYDSWELHSTGLASEARGDVNRDGTTTDADLDALARYLLADGPAVSPAADVNGDSVINTRDLFYLINYRRGTGPAPIP